MTQSKWISTEDILNDVKIPFFELAKSISSGNLQPFHPTTGEPLLPPDFLELGRLQHAFESGIAYAWDPGKDAAMQDLLKWRDWDRLQDLERQLKDRDVKKPWQGYVFRGGEVEYFRGAQFLRSEFDLAVKGNDSTPKETKLRPSQRQKAACRKIAEDLWAQYPDMTIADMAFRDEMVQACDGKIYPEKTIRNWIKDLCPNRSPGRRPAK